MNKVVVVTGGASGIGQAVVERLARDDFTGVILDINEEGGKEVAAEIQGRGKEATFIRLDVTQEADVQKAFQKIISDHGRLDVLVNVAGGSLHRHGVENFPLDHWRAVIDLNLTSTFLCCRAVAGLMKSQRSGAIVNISSDIGFSGDANRSAYAAAKAGIVGSRRRWRSRSRRSMCAPMWWLRDGSPPSVSGRLTPTPSGKPRPKEFPSATRASRRTSPKPWPFSPATRARHMTGQTLHVNGGRIMG